MQGANIREKSLLCGMVLLAWLTYRLSEPWLALSRIESGSGSQSYSLSHIDQSSNSNDPKGTRKVRRSIPPLTKTSRQFDSGQENFPASASFMEFRSHLTAERVKAEARTPLNLIVFSTIAAKRGPPHSLIQEIPNLS